MEPIATEVFDATKRAMSDTELRALLADERPLYEICEACGHVQVDSPIGDGTGQCDDCPCAEPIHTDYERWTAYAEGAYHRSLMLSVTDHIIARRELERRVEALIEERDRYKTALAALQEETEQ